MRIGVREHEYAERHTECGSDEKRRQPSPAFQPVGMLILATG
jgi:hypothetical protein